MIDFFKGIGYNLRGLKMGLQTPSLLLLGFLRFAVFLALAAAAAVLLFNFHGDIMAALWHRPESRWLVWLWHLAAWLVSLLLFAGAAVAGYLVCQILFMVFIMEWMSQLTERIVSGTVQTPAETTRFATFVYLIRQEIPRTLLPLGLMLLLTAAGWLTPLGPLLAVAAAMATAVFLAWDHTDLAAARRQIPFRRRFRFLLQTLPLHLGFGLPFLIPGVNILLLSFAPVGGTLFFIERRSTETF